MVIGRAGLGGFVSPLCHVWQHLQRSVSFCTFTRWHVTAQAQLTDTPPVCFPASVPLLCPVLICEPDTGEPLSVCSGRPFETPLSGAPHIVHFLCHIDETM